MNKLRLWVLVMVAVGILTGCDSCDDGMDYPIVVYAQGVSASQITNPAKLEEIRLGLKRMHSDIKIIEIIASGSSGRSTAEPSKVKLAVAFVNGWESSLTPAQVNAAVTSEIYNASVSKAAPAGNVPALAWNLPAMAGKSPATACNLPAMAGNLPAMACNFAAMACNLPAMAGKSPAMAGNLAALAWNLPAMAFA